MGRYTLQALGIVLLLVFQISFLPTWQWPISSLDIVLLAVLFVTVIVSHRTGLAWAAALGWLLELYSPTPFGLILVSLVVTVGAVHLLAAGAFTNRSLYALLASGAVGTVTFAAVKGLGGNALGALGLGGLPPVGLGAAVASTAWQVLFNSVGLAITFAVFNFVSRRLKSAFVTS